MILLPRFILVQKIKLFDRSFKNVIDQLKKEKLDLCKTNADLRKKNVKSIFHLTPLFARREAKTRIRRHDWLKLAGEKNCRDQVVTNSPSGK